MENNLVSVTSKTIDQNDMRSPRHVRSNFKENKKSSKAYNLIPYLKKANNKLFSKRGSDLLLNQQLNDPDDLKQQLNTCKAKMYEQNRNFLSLKIKYGKLKNENASNKNLISNVLGVPLDKNLTKDEFLDKIEHAKMNKFNREMLKEAVDTIILKAEIDNKKEKYRKLQNYLKELEENSKTKKMNEILKDYISKCEEQRSLLRILKALGEKNSEFEAENKKINENLEKEVNNKREVTKKKEEKFNEYEKLNSEKTELTKENKNLDEKIKRNTLLNRDKDDKNIKIKLDINDMKEIADDLESYKKERDTKLKYFEEKKTIVEDLKNARREQENNIRQLNQERDKLDDKMAEYNSEKTKLIKKSKEPKSDIDKMKKLEKEITELKMTNKNLNEIHEKKKTKLNKLSEKEKENSGLLEENQKNNDLLKNELNQKITELKDKIKNLEEQKIHIQKEALSIIKTSNEKLKQENEKMKKENEQFQQEIKDYDEKLKDYDKVKGELKKAEEKRDSLNEEYESEEEEEEKVDKEKEKEKEKVV